MLKGPWSTIPGMASLSSIAFENVSVRIGGVSILDGVGASVPRGSWTAVVGPNGAGKTTLLLALLGQVPFSRGGSACRNGMAGAPRASAMFPSGCSSTAACP
jgi:zinc transport system ATP-binding protein